MVIERNKLLIILITTVIIFLNVILSVIGFSDYWFYYIMSVMGIVAFFWILSSWIIVNKIIFSIYPIFILCSFAIYWGQPFAELLGCDLYNLDVYSITKYSHRVCAITMCYIIVAYLLIHIGAFAFSNKKEKSFNDETYDKDYSSAMNTVGVIMVLVSLVPQIVLIYNSIVSVKNNGYIGLFLSENTLAVGGTLNNIARFFVPGLFMLIIANSENVAKARRYVIICVIYIGIVFLVGKRGENTLFLIALILVWHKRIRKFDKKAIIGYIILGLFLFVFLYVISSIRPYLNQGDAVSLAASVFEHLSVVEIIRNMFAELGMSLLVPITIVNYVPSYLPFYYGKSYLNFFLLLIPNTFWEINPGLVDGTLESIVSPFVRNGTVGGIGASYVAELYYNFGYYSLLFFPIIGNLLYRLSYNIDCKKTSKVKFYILIYVFTKVLWVIRGEIMTCGKEIMYYAIFPAIIVWLVSKFKNRMVINYEKNSNYGKKL